MPRNPGPLVNELQSFMKRMLVYNLILTAALAGTAGATTIEAVVAETLKRNPELRFYEAELQAARAGRRSAGLLDNPEVSGSFGQKTVREAGVNSDGPAWSVSVMQPFEWPGRIGLRKAIANRDVELAELGLARFRAALAGQARSLAYGYLAASEKASASREVAARFQALREVLVQRDPAGLTPLLETRVIEATDLTMQRKAVQTTLAAQTALMELNQLRGAEPGALPVITQASPAFRPAPAMDALFALARTNNFELRLRYVELAQQGLRVDLARNERYPDISVGPTISEEQAGSRERTIGISVSLPLPLWNRNTANVEAARARQQQAEVSYRVLERDIRRRVAEAALAYETGLREMSQWRSDSVQHFREAAELADRHYRLGAVPVSTYVELQEKYLDAVESLLDTRKETLEAALKLELLTGLTPTLATSPAPEEAP